jgi:polysaccharide deacetylase 2 family uncharacterized protein YibQ
MPSKRRIKRKKHYHVLLILFSIVAAVFFLFKEFRKEDLPPGVTWQVPQKKLPKVAVVIDDLGPNKKAAENIFHINVPLTLSVIPHERYTEWIAEQGHSLGYDVIAHVPMEAQKPHRLGKGGLYTWMTEGEIRETLEADFDSVPYIKGISNHMGSAFTEDERTMDILISVLKEHRFFFLDSLTTPKSAGARLARQQGVKALKRDIFLDNQDNPDYIEAQWERLINIARKRGYAIALAHPRKNTLKFLEKTLPSRRVTAVLLSELAVYP